MKANEINKPEPKRYYIVEVDGELLTHGCVEENQVLTTKHKIIQFDTKEEYEEKLLLRGVELNEEMEEFNKLKDE